MDYTLPHPPKASIQYQVFLKSLEQYLEAADDFFNKRERLHAIWERPVPPAPISVYWLSECLSLPCHTVRALIEEVGREPSAYTQLIHVDDEGEPSRATSHWNTLQSIYQDFLAACGIEDPVTAMLPAGAWFQNHTVGKIMPGQAETNVLGEVLEGGLGNA